MFLMTSILNFGNPSKESFADSNLWKKGNTTVKEKVATPVTVTPSTQVAPEADARTEKYVIESGDTLEKVAIKFYGDPSPSKIEKIQQINNLDDPNRISIGQELMIPLEN
ncbi:MAG: LysM peptidoglycan-binding domain-containing protein [Desulfobacterales bacterium]|nr:LysM peptidoglycan-binding domain-containing protein [Desulfobacterales bacterium]